MTFNPDKLVSAPILQDYLVDKVTGFPLAGGKIYLYRDSDQTTIKRWYYQIGTYGAYTYVPLYNPLTLSSVGTITDPNGNDVIPFFYPFSEEADTDDLVERYYITVEDSNAVPQFTRANFPFGAGSATPITTTGDNTSLITNGEFWRNIGSLLIDSTKVAPNINNQIYSKVPLTINNVSLTLNVFPVAPSQHDNFLMPDICLAKDTIDSIDTITFSNFVLGVPVLPAYEDNVLPNDITPQYYMNFHCTSPGTETIKYIQIPIQSNVTSLSGYGPYTIVLSANTIGGAASITVELFQFLGSGVNSPTPSLLKTIALNTNWQNYVITVDTLPSAQGLISGTSLGSGGDDGFYLKIGLPKGAGGSCNINIAKPAFYLGNVIPENNWETYDKINSVISAPKTGQVITSINNYHQFGYVPMNDGTIGFTNASIIPLNTRANSDTWLLYNLLWNNYKQFDIAGLNPICQMYANNATLTAAAYGASSYADFIAGKGLRLTKMFGRVLAGTVPIWDLLPKFQVEAVTASDGTPNLVFTKTDFVAPDLYPYYNGQPLIFTFATGGSLPGGIVENTIYYAANVSGATFNVSTTYANATAEVPIVLAFVSAGSMVQAKSAYTGIYDGEDAHVQKVRELASHSHGFNLPILLRVADTPGFVSDAYGAQPGTPLTISNTGSSNAFNIRQLETYYNVFMKL